MDDTATAESEPMQQVQFGKLGILSFPASWSDDQIESDVAKNKDRYRDSFIGEAMQEAATSQVEPSGITENKSVQSASASIATTVGGAIQGVGRAAAMLLKPHEYGEEPRSANEIRQVWSKAELFDDYVRLKETPEGLASLQDFNQAPIAVKKAWADMRAENKLKVDEWRKWTDRRLKASVGNVILESGRAAQENAANTEGNQTASDLSGATAGMLPIIATSMIPGVATTIVSASTGEEVRNQAEKVYTSWGIPQGDAEEFAMGDGAAAAALAAATMGLTHKLYGAGKTLMGKTVAKDAGPTIAANLLARAFSNAEVVTMKTAAKAIGAAAVQNGGDVFANMIMQGAWAMKTYRPELTWEQALDEAAHGAIENGLVGAGFETFAQRWKYNRQAPIREIIAAADKIKKPDETGDYKSTDVGDNKGIDITLTNPNVAADNAENAGAPATAAALKGEEGQLQAINHEILGDALKSVGGTEEKTTTATDDIQIQKEINADEAASITPTATEPKKKSLLDEYAEGTQARMAAAGLTEESSRPDTVTEKLKRQREVAVKTHARLEGYSSEVSERLAYGNDPIESIAEQAAKEDPKVKDVTYHANKLNSIREFQTWVNAKGEAKAKAELDALWAKSQAPVGDPNADVSVLPTTGMRNGDIVEVDGNKFKASIGDKEVFLFPLSKDDGSINPFGTRRVKFGPDSFLTVDGYVERDLSGRLARFVPDEAAPAEGTAAKPVEEPKSAPAPTPLEQTQHGATVTPELINSIPESRGLPTEVLDAKMVHDLVYGKANAGVAFDEATKANLKKLSESDQKQYFNQRLAFYTMIRKLREILKAPENAKKTKSSLLVANDGSMLSVYDGKTTKTEADRKFIEQQSRRIGLIWKTKMDPALRRFIGHLIPGDRAGLNGSPMAAKFHEDHYGTVEFDAHEVAKMDDISIIHMLNEEAIHHADQDAVRGIYESLVKAGKFEGEINDFSHWVRGKLASEMTPTQRKWIEDRYNSGKRMSSYAAAAEYIRAIIQQRRTGATSESDLRNNFDVGKGIGPWTKRILASIRDWFMHRTAMWKASPLIRKHIADIESLINGRAAGRAAVDEMSRQIDLEYANKAHPFERAPGPENVRYVQDSQMTDFGRRLRNQEPEDPQQELIPLRAGQSKNAPSKEQTTTQAKERPSYADDSTPKLPIPKPVLDNKGLPIEVRVAGGTYIYQHEPGGTHTPVENTFAHEPNTLPLGHEEAAGTARPEIPTPPALERLGEKPSGSLYEDWRHPDVELPADVFGHALDVVQKTFDDHPKSKWMTAGQREDGVSFVSSRLLNRIADFMKANPDSIVPGKVNYYGKLRDGLKLDGFSYKKVVDNLWTDYVRRINSDNRAHTEVSIDAKVAGDEGGTMSLAEVLPQDEPPRGSYGDIWDAYDGERAKREFQRAVADLPPDGRRMIELSLQNGERTGWQEIEAQQQGLTPARISQRLELAKVQLLRSISRFPDAVAYVLGYMPRNLIKDPTLSWLRDQRDWDVLNAATEFGVDTPYGAEDYPYLVHLYKKWEKFGRTLDWKNLPEDVIMDPRHLEAGFRDLLFEWLDPKEAKQQIEDILANRAQRESGGNHEGNQMDLFAPKLPSSKTGGGSKRNQQPTPTEDRARDLSAWEKVKRVMHPGWWGATGYIRQVADQLRIRGSRAAGTLNYLADRIDYQIDTHRKLTGRWEAPFFAITNKMGEEQMQRMFNEVEQFVGSAQAGRSGAALQHSFRHAMNTVYPGMTPEAKRFVDEMQAVAKEIGAFKTTLGVHVVNGRHEWRPFNDLGEMYFPRVLKREYQEMLKDPDSNPMWRRTIERDLMMHDPHRFPDPQSVDRALYEHKASLEQAGEFAAGVDLQRTDVFPENWYDSSAETWIKNLDAQARRLSEIAAYGQDRPGQKTIWDLAMEQATRQSGVAGSHIEMDGLKDAVGQIRTAVLETQYKHWGGWVNKLAMGMAAYRYLSAFMTMTRNVLGANSMINESLGVKNGIQQSYLGLWDAGRALIDSYKQGKWTEPAMVEAAMAAGTAQRAIFISTIHNLDIKPTTWVGKKMNQVMMVNQLAENWNRAVNHAAAAAWLADTRRQLNIDPTSRKSKQGLAQLRRWGFEGARLQMLLSANGEAYNAFLRKAVYEKQYGYKADQTPITFKGGSMGRMFLQFQSWGAQRQRDLARNVLYPAFVGERYGIGPEKIRNGKPLLMFVLCAVANGMAVKKIASIIFGRDSRDEDWHEVISELNDNTQHGLYMMAGKILTDLTATGAAGVLPDHLKMLKDAISRGRDKSQIRAPGAEFVNDVMNFVARQSERNGDPKALWRDFRDLILRKTPLIKEVEDFARHTLLSGTDYGLLHANQQTLGVTRSLLRRYNTSIGAEDKNYTRAGASMKSPNSETFDGIQEALLVGDADEAGRLVNEATKDRTDKKMLQNISRSISQRQPIAGVHRMTPAEYKAFLEWVDSRRPGFRSEIERIEDGYKATAKQIGLMKGAQ